MLESTKCLRGIIKSSQRFAPSWRTMEECSLTFRMVRPTLFLPFPHLYSQFSFPPSPSLFNHFFVELFREISVSWWNVFRHSFRSKEPIRLYRRHTSQLESLNDEQRRGRYLWRSGNNLNFRFTTQHQLLVPISQTKVT